MDTADFAVSLDSLIAGCRMHCAEQSHVSCVFPNHTQQVVESTESNVTSVHGLDYILRQNFFLREMFSVIPHRSNSIRSFHKQINKELDTRIKVVHKYTMILVEKISKKAHDNTI